MRSAALDRLERLIGAWDLTMTNAFFLDSLEMEVAGHASFEWLDDVLVVFRFEIGEPPPAVGVIGHSDPREQFYMLYHDDRGVARVFEMEFSDSGWSLLREDPDFHQRFTGSSRATTESMVPGRHPKTRAGPGERTSTSYSRGHETERSAGLSFSV